MTRSAIKKSVEYWKNKLGLVNWSVNVDFKPLNYPKATENFTGIARTECQSSYKLANIVFDSKMLGQVDSSVILHELTHCLFADLVGYARANIDHKEHNTAEAWLCHWEESVVTEIERIILRLHRK